MGFFESFPKRKEEKPKAKAEAKVAEAEKAKTKSEPLWAGEEQEKERSEAAKRLGLPGRPSWGEINAAEEAREKKKWF